MPKTIAQRRALIKKTAAKKKASVLKKRQAAFKKKMNSKPAKPRGANKRFA